MCIRPRGILARFSWELGRNDEKGTSRQPPALQSGLPRRGDMNVICHYPRLFRARAGESLLVTLGSATKGRYLGSGDGRE